MDHIEIMRYTGGTIGDLFQILMELNMIRAKYNGTPESIDVSWIEGRGDQYSVIGSDNLLYKSADGTKQILVFMSDNKQGREEIIKSIDV